MGALIDKKDGLDRRPHDIGENAWYYEEPDGLHVIHQGHGSIGIIKWRSLEASLKRKRTKRGKAAK